MKSDFTNFLHFSFGFENPIYIIDPFRSSSKRKIDLNSASHELLNCWITILLSLAFVGWLTVMYCGLYVVEQQQQHVIKAGTKILFVDFHSFWFLWFLQCTPYLSGASWNLKHLLHNYARKKYHNKRIAEIKWFFINTYAIPPCFPGKKSLFVLAIIHAWNKNFISCSCHVIWIIVIHCKSVNCFSFAFEPLCANSDYCKIRLRMFLLLLFLTVFFLLSKYIIHKNSKTLHITGQKTREIK